MTTKRCRLPKDIAENPDYEPFEDCIGALDGIFIPVSGTPKKVQDPWRNRHGVISQNVLAAVNFNYEFINVLAGWEGCASDVQVFNSAISKGQLKIPEKKYFLADPAYQLQKGLMIPFRGARYDPKEKSSGGITRPENKEELFNSRHATLRKNIVEEIFGCMKRKFLILQTAHEEVELDKQIRLVYALCMLWNFIRKHEPLENLFDETDESAEPNCSNFPRYPLTSLDNDAYLKKERERIATELWNQSISNTGQA